MPDTSLEALPAPIIDVRMTPAVKEARIGGRWNNWILFDNRGKKVSEGHILTGGLTASVGRLFETVPRFDHALTAWLLEPDTANATLRLARSEQPKPGIQIFAFVDRANVTCPIGEVLEYLDDRLQRIERTDVSVVVPATWSTRDITSFRHTFGDRLPVQKLDGRLTQAWRRMVRFYGPAEAGAFVAVFVNGTLHAIHLRPQPLQVFVNEFDKAS